MLVVQLLLDVKSKDRFDAFGTGRCYQVVVTLSQIHLLTLLLPGRSRVARDNSRPHSSSGCTTTIYCCVVYSAAGFRVLGQVH